jgi:hypothetical protein
MSASSLVRQAGETELASGWDKARGTSKLAWNDAKAATRDAWDRIDGRR